jgi:hypothetical protein
MGSGRAKQPPLLMPASARCSATSGAYASASATGAPSKPDAAAGTMPCGAWADLAAACAESGRTLELPACGNGPDGTAPPGAVTRRTLFQRALADGAGALTAGESSPLPPLSAGVGGRMLLRPPELGLVGPTLCVLCEVSQWEPVNVAANGSTSTPPITKAQPRGGRSLARHSGLAPAGCPGPAGCWRHGFSRPAGFPRDRRPRSRPCGCVTCSDLQRHGRLAAPSAAAGATSAPGRTRAGIAAAVPARTLTRGAALTAEATGQTAVHQATTTGGELNQDLGKRKNYLAGLARAAPAQSAGQNGAGKTGRRYQAVRPPYVIGRRLSHRSFSET